jgi:hypothetical protein
VEVHASNIPWIEIERECIAGLTFEDAGRKFNVKAGTIRRRSLRHHWPTPTAVVKRARALGLKSAEKTLDKAAVDWTEKGETHRIKAFEIASESVAKFKPKAPKTFRELEAADKIARRAAGLDVSEVQVQTLIQMNESINEFDQQPEEIVDAEVIEVIPDSEPAAALPA